MAAPDTQKQMQMCCSQKTEKSSVWGKSAHAEGSACVAVTLQKEFALGHSRVFFNATYAPDTFFWLVLIFYIKQPRNTRANKLYSRSQLLHELKHVLDVFRGLLPHVVGLLTTHVCARSDWDGVERGEWVGEERHVNTEPPRCSPIIQF